MTAIEIIDDDTFIGGENSSNIIVCQRDRSVRTQESLSFRSSGESLWSAILYA